jgi:hypothetical protein|nr:MAG TPA: hypothetical protein [Caudoviricetes sp.]
MAKFTKPFLGVPDGEIYPVQYEKGDEVPAELLEAAKEAGCVNGKKGDSKLPEDPPSDNKQDGGTGNETDTKQTGEGEGQGEGQGGAEGSQQTDQQ